MNGHKWALALVALLCAGSVGALPRGQEMESRKLVTALALDGGEETKMTAVTGVRVSEDEEPEVLTGSGESLTAAWGDLRENSSRRVYLGQTEQLLVGRGQDLGRALDFAVEHRELRLDTLLYIVKGEAGPALEASAQKTAGETGGEDFRGVTVGEVMPRLAEGEYAAVPALEPDGEGQLSPGGWAVLGSDGVAGYLDGEAALGALLLSGKAQGQAAALDGGGVELSSARCWAKDGRLCCALAARITEGAPTKEALEQWGEEKLRAALDAGWDCWGLDRELAGFQPWAWEEVRGTDIRTLKVEVKGRLVGNGG